MVHGTTMCCTHFRCLTSSVALFCGQLCSFIYKKFAKGIDEEAIVGQKIHTHNLVDLRLLPQIVTWSFFVVRSLNLRLLFHMLKYTTRLPCSVRIYIYVTDFLLLCAGIRINQPLYRLRTPPLFSGLLKNPAYLVLIIDRRYQCRLGFSRFPKHLWQGCCHLKALFLNCWWYQHIIVLFGLSDLLRCRSTFFLPIFWICSFNSSTSFLNAVTSSLPLSCVEMCVM